MDKDKEIILGLVINLNDPRVRYGLCKETICWKDGAIYIILVETDHCSDLVEPVKLV